LIPLSLTSLLEVSFLYCSEFGFYFSRQRDGSSNREGGMMDAKRVYY
jgi:hypothetical protein